MQLKNLVPALLLVFVTSGCTKVTSVRHVSGYNKSMLAHKEILVLPMQPEIYTLDVGNRKERKYDYEDHLEELLKQEILLAAKQNGLRVKLLHRRDIRSQKLDDIVARFLRSYNDAYEALYTSLFWEEEKAFSITSNIGESATVLGQKTSTDIFILLKYVQMIKTNGARTRDFLMSAFGFGCSTNDADTIFMSVGIVEAKSGRILWTNATPKAQPFSSSIFSSRDKSEIENFHAVINMLLSRL